MSIIGQTCGRALCLASVVATLLVLDSAVAQQQIRVDGSTGTAPLVRALGKAFAAKGGATIEVGKGLGTKARIEALESGKIDIAMASHGLDVEAVTKRGMVVHRMAMTPVVFGVHESVKVNDLTEAQICAVFEGKTRDWKEVGGQNLAIVPLARPESEVDMEVVRAGIVCFKDLKLASNIKLEARAGDMAKALAETTGGIGITSMTVAMQSGGKIQPLRLNGTSANEETVKSGQYRLTRDAFLVTGKQPSASVNAFISFVKSAAGAEVIRANGAFAAAQ